MSLPLGYKDGVYGAELVPSGSRVADVGTGHARLPVWLLAHRRAEACVATDSDAAAVERARGALPEHGALELRLGRELPGDLGVEDVAVVAGGNVDPGIAIRTAVSDKLHRSASLGRLMKASLRPWP